VAHDLTAIPFAERRAQALVYGMEKQGFHRAVYKGAGRLRRRAFER
jgi:hypothetical protein